MGTFLLHIAMLSILPIKPDASYLPGIKSFDLFALGERAKYNSTMM
jgi:hypothetical protein